MPSPAAIVTLAPLQAQPDFASSTITVSLQISFQSGGYYETGGVPSGVQAYMSSIGVNINQFLQAVVMGEVASSGGQIYTYRYIPATDQLQIVSNGSELSSSSGMPAGVINDTVVGRFTYNRL